MAKPANVIGDMIRSKRRRAGITRTQLADVIGGNYATVVRWENGRMQPRRETLARVLAMLERIISGSLRPPPICRGGHGNKKPLRVAG